MTHRQRRGAFLLLLGALVAAMPADAFNRLHGGANGQGPAVFWRAMPVKFAIQSRCALGDDPNALNPAVATAGEDEDTFNQLCHAAIQRSFASWEAPSCTRLRFQQLPDTAVREVGYDPNLGSANLNTVQFMAESCDSVVDPGDACWNEGTCDDKYSCFGHGSSVVALTSTFSDPSDGHLFDADIEGNAADYSFSAETGEPLGGTIDVQNTLTHEAGHFIGLAHSCEAGQSCPSDLLDTTMYWQESNLAETTKRTLKQDDIDGLCSIYAADGGDDPAGCQVAPTGATSPPLAPLLGLALVLFLARANRRSSSGAQKQIPLR
jgi:MYXO-CTERM domain-containing protein